jgi:hypothetical protein
MLAGAGGGSRGMLGRLLTLKKRGLSGARERARVCGSQRVRCVGSDLQAMEQV